MVAQSIRYATVQAAARHWNVSTRTIRRRIAEGKLKAVRVGPRSIRVAVEDVEQLGEPIPSATDRGDAA
jgi:excisionase family DNA binding protein